jgi:hypothetical protein
MLSVMVVLLLLSSLVGLYKYFVLKSEFRALQSSFDSGLQLQFGSGNERSFAVPIGAAGAN